MTAAKQNITIQQGATFADVLWVKQPAPPGTPVADLLALDLTGYDVRMHIRTAVADADPNPVPLLALTLANDRITVDAAAGAIYRRIDPADTQALTFVDAAVYDLELQAPDGSVERLVQGRVTLDREVTRG